MKKMTVRNLVFLLVLVALVASLLVSACTLGAGVHGCGITHRPPGTCIICKCDHGYDCQWHTNPNCFNGPRPHN
jgi:hypothetical protein